MIKLIASDMDGTLLDEKGNLPSNFYEVFESLKENNTIFVAASGRQYYNLRDKFDKVKNDMMFIAENGTYVVYKEKELFSNTLDKEIIPEFINLTRSINNAYSVLCGKKCAYIEDNLPELIAEVSKYYAKFEVVDDLNNVNDEFIKFTICDLDGSEENCNKHFDKFRHDYQVCVSGQIWLDITNKGANKGVAIKKVQEILNIDFNETMVFGDYLNDLEMMESAYYSYAMENAHEDLKKVSRFVTKKNTENGVLDKIEEVVLGKVLA